MSKQPNVEEAIKYLRDIFERADLQKPKSRIRNQGGLRNEKPK